ncbi:hypothetical protein E6O75_ATG00313 [Venturia nashicola]|uniref:Uncharacterized protein n=1 Tax=Venturia nashicola TaxID=86259 RepID=A0A4Z1PG23_9PEZI|nr:hypothetical protein E6O75_ATG00313 [Venturia nashicola]
MSQPNPKRAKSRMAEDAKQNKASTIGSHKGENTTFFSLPREIRQKILTEVLADTLGKDFALMDILTYFRFELQRPVHFHPTRNHVKAPHLSNAASTLRKVHPKIEKDLSYVLNKQLAQIETYYDDWNASGNVWDYKDTEFWKAAAPRWFPLMYRHHELDDKKLCRRLHQILGAVNPADAGCWKRFKLHSSWMACIVLFEIGLPLERSESDQEDEAMDDAEKQLHVDSKCDCGQITKE